MKLKRNIGKVTLLLLAVNAILGTGIFFLPAVGAAYAGPASLVSWAVMGVAAILISMCFAELVSMYPKAGGVYEYTKKAFGEFWSFVIGWTAWIVANITIAMLVVGSLYYLLPAQSMPFYTAASLLIILLFNYVNYRGIDWSSKLLVFFGVVTLASVAAIIFPGLPAVNHANYSPFFVFPAASIFLAIYFISETFFGWETTTYLAEEIKDVRRTLPRMLVIATCLIAVISILVAYVSLGVSDWKEFSGQQAPLVFIASKIFGGGFAPLFAVLVFIPLIGTAAGWIVSSPRLLYAMARDRLLLKGFEKIHPKYRTPHNAIVFQTIASSLITVIGLGSYLVLISLLIPLVLIVYSAVLLSVVKLSGKKIARGYVSPFNDKLPLLLVAFNAMLMMTWLELVPGASGILALGVLLVLMGFPLYMLMKLQHDKKFIEKVFDDISFLWDKAFPVWYGKKETDFVLSKLSLRDNSRVLDYGCGSGITTLAVAEKARKGTVVAVDISKGQLERALNKVKNAGMPNVVFVKESEAAFPKGSFDAVVCVGTLEYLDEPRKELRKILAPLKRGGTFSFLSFGRSFGLPASDFLSSEQQLKKLFTGMGVSFSVRKEKKKFAEYYYVWGRKKA
ncbi:MAG: amino acid permease [Candidatus Aenigmarchaeota archaeon]|nr:amino acid permease [Candidatus Aenigmarchaeota archaeon]